MTLSPSEYINMEGSSTLMEKIEQSIVLSVTDKAAKNKRIKVKKGAKVATKTQTKGKADSPKPKGYKVKKVRAGPIIRGSGRQRTGAGQRSFFSIMAMINKKLPPVLKKNMRAPRLENQSGRFAASVKLQDVNTTPQGHPSFGYTYEKDPYQIFEVGTGKAPWSTPQRDPRKLIDASIREIAGQMAIGRFYTRRL